MTERLIERLVAEAQPVRRLPPPAVRSARWLLSIATLGVLAVALLGDHARLQRLLGDPGRMVETVAIVLTGIAAVLAAFHLAVPGRGAGWLAAPLPFLAVWLAASGYGCLAHAGGSWRQSGDCFLFLLGVGLPLGLSLFLLLRRAAPLDPARVALTGALGAAAVAAALLQFFHSFDVTWIDLAVHGLAVLSLLAVARAGSGFLWRPRGELQ